MRVVDSEPRVRYTYSITSQEWLMSATPALRRTPFESGTRIEVLVEDKVASSVLVYDRLVRIGGKLFTCGGIGDVSTRREHRQHGYARMMMQDAVAYMQEKQFHFSALFGIPNFYPKFGYVVALPGIESSVPLRDAEFAQARYSVRELEPADHPRVAKIYEQMTAERTFSCARDPKTWSGFRIGGNWSDRIGAFVVLDGDKIIGYASYELNPGHHALGEIGYSTPNAWSTILAEGTRQALEKRVELLVLHAPADDPFLHYARRYGCSTSLNYARNSGGMARLIDQSTVLKALRPVFKRRLESSGSAWRGTLLFKTDLGATSVKLGEGTTTTLELPQTLLTQWLLGYREIAESLFESDVIVPDELIEVLQAIFPFGYPYIYATDRF